MNIKTFLKKAFVCAGFFIFAQALFAQAAVGSRGLNAKQEDDILRQYLWNKFINLPKEKRPKIGLTLSAGGIRGLSHIGTMEVLRASGLPVDYMSGTSMGCIVGALYTSGVSSQRMWELAKDPKFSYVSKDLTVIGFLKYLLGNKLFSADRFEQFISEEIGGVNYEDLPIPFGCVAADIKTGEKIVFDSGPVALGVHASMNLPGIFAPVEYRQRFLVDGGVVDYIPVDLVKEDGAEWVLAVFALPDYSKTTPSTILGYLVRTGDLRGAVLMENSEKMANYVIVSRVGDINFIDPSQSLRAAEIGAKETYAALDDMKENLLLFSTKYVYK